MANHAKTNNSNFLVDPIFYKFNRLFVLLFMNGDNRTSYSKYYTPIVEIKDFSVVIDGKNFFNVPIMNKEETYKKLLK